MASSGVYIVQGELNAVVAFLRRAHRWPPHQPQLLDEQDPLLRNFSDLREVLNSFNDLDDMAPNTFLEPFLNVIRSEHTSGPVTGQALTSVGKFLSYGLISPTDISAASAVENIADAVTHARFVGTDSGSDEVVLLKILQVLRTLLLTPVGHLLTNESVCEIMQSCFRICFETRLSEILRKAAEYTLSDMIQLLFTRLPTFKEDPRHPYIRKLKMRASLFDPNRVKRRKKYKGKAKANSNPKSALKAATSDASGNNEPESQPDQSINVTEESSKLDMETKCGTKEIQNVEVPQGILKGVASDVCIASPTDDEGSARMVDLQSSLAGFASEEEGPISMVASPVEEAKPLVGSPLEGSAIDSTEEVRSPDSGVGPEDQEAISPAVEAVETPERSREDNEDTTLNEDDELDEQHYSGEEGPALQVKSRVNQRGVRFTVEGEEGGEGGEKEDVGPHIPYGLPCIRELFRFLISLTNPLDKQNTEQMIQMGLGLLTVALEGGADALGSYSVLMPLVKNELCRSVFLLLQTDKLPVFSSALRVCFLLFEALRTHLKFQLETYLSKLMELIVSESGRISFEQKEMALEGLVQLWRIPGLVTELYLNYDCDLYCSNLFEDITKLLSKNAFPVTGLFSTHILSLDALLTVVDTIEGNCHYRMMLTHQEPNQPSVNDEAGGTENKNMAGSVMVRPNRMPISKSIPSHEDLISQKKKKRLLTVGTELFNQTPSKGVSFLQEHGLLQTPLVPEEIVEWLKENPRLDKKKIAEYIVSRKKANILAAFVKSFNFEGVRIDDALRMFLEAFRLPGEAAEISMVIEHFADHWHTANDEPFVNTDAAFTLSYAIIMLNVDQWNMIAKRQQQPMTNVDFRRNLSGVNGGTDFDHEMLDDIYSAIRQEEIVMPAEHTGLIKENYMWKVLLRRGASKDGDFIHAPSGLYDHDLFGLIWGPTIAALSFVFDKSEGETILQKSMSGFRKCSAIAAHYGMNDVFDNLIISLCKFSTLISAGGDTPEQLPIVFGENSKAHMAARVMFQLVHSHGDILREGWKNILDCLLHLYRAKMLPKSLSESEDFVDPKGWVSIIKEPIKLSSQRSESGLLSSLVLILGGSGHDGKEAKAPTPEEQEHIKMAHSVIAECHPEQIVIDSKYLTSEAVAELLEAIVNSSAGVSSGTPDGTRVPGVLNEQKENAIVFYLELMLSIALENRDRLGPFWTTIKNHLGALLSDYRKNPFLVERAVVGLLRLAVRLLFRDEISDEVLQSLSMLQFLRPSTVHRLAQQITFGLHELLRTNAANIHQKDHWSILFGLLEAAGAAAFPDNLSKSGLRGVGPRGGTPKHLAAGITHADSMQNLPTKKLKNEDEDYDEDDDLDMPSASDVDRGYTSDSELERASSPSSGIGSSVADQASAGGSGEWMYVQHGEGSIVAKEMSLQNSGASGTGINKYSIVLRPGLRRHEPKAFLKACETLAFLVRDVAHITPENLESCIQCLRTFVEASLDGGRYAHIPKPKEDETGTGGKHGRREKKIGLRRGRGGNQAGVHERPDTPQDEEGGTEGEPTLTDNYHQVSHQLIDLCHTIHVKAKQIFESWAVTGDCQDVTTAALWHRCWRPLLQCMARLCCDCRRQIRTYALNYLQRAFLVHDLQSLSPEEWEDCFTKVLFPLLAKLLDNISPMDPLGMEETRVRTMALLCKVFLQHLSPLSSLPTFNALWLTILDFMERYLHTDRSDLLAEAIPESLKNMLLVMETASMFLTTPGLFSLTQDRLSSFLPKLVEEVLPSPPTEPSVPVSKTESPIKTPAALLHDQPHGETILQEPASEGKTMDPHYDPNQAGNEASESSAGPQLPDVELGLEEVVIHPHAAMSSSPPPPVPHPPGGSGFAPPDNPPAPIVVPNAPATAAPFFAPTKNPQDGAGTRTVPLILGQMKSGLPPSSSSGSLLQAAQMDAFPQYGGTLGPVVSSAASGFSQMGMPMSARVGPGHVILHPPTTNLGTPTSTPSSVGQPGQMASTHIHHPNEAHIQQGQPHP